MEFNYYLKADRSEESAVREAVLKAMIKTYGEPEYEDDIWWSWRNINTKDNKTTVLGLFKEYSIISFSVS